MRPRCAPVPARSNGSTRRCADRPFSRNATRDRRAWRPPPSGGPLVPSPPLRASLPLILDDDAGCLPPGFDGGCDAPQAWMEMLVDGTAVGEGIPGLHPGRPSRWCVDVSTRATSPPRHALESPILRRRWARLNAGAAEDAALFARIWEPRSVAQRGCFGALQLAVQTWGGDLALRPDGTCAATLSVSVTGTG